MSKHRSREDIVADILSIVKDGSKKTHIMYRANLSYALLCKYLDKLVSGGLIRCRKTDAVYVLTKKGETYLSAYLEYTHLRSQMDANKSVLDKKEAALTEILQVND